MMSFFIFQLTTSSLFKSLTFSAISGPTNDQVPTFSWLTSPYRTEVKHKGQPETFDFDSIIHEWEY